MSSTPSNQKKYLMSSRPDTKTTAKKNIFKDPLHVGIIMDGNGRWALQKKLDRTDGHTNGIDPVKTSLLASLQLNIPYLSLFVFSTENWKRPKYEVQFILNLLSTRLRNNYDFYRENDIRIIHSGKRDGLSSKVLHEIDSVIDETKDNKSITLNMAFNYGGKDEIIRAIKKYMMTEQNADTLTEETFSQYFDSPELPDIDLLIRTGEQKRLSNFLLWKLAYSEIYFSKVLWPNWTKDDFLAAIDFFRAQKRNFGLVTNNRSPS